MLRASENTYYTIQEKRICKQFGTRLSNVLSSKIIFPETVTTKISIEAIRRLKEAYPYPIYKDSEPFTVKVVGGLEPHDYTNIVEQYHRALHEIELIQRAIRAS